MNNIYLTSYIFSVKWKRFVSFKKKNVKKACHGHSWKGKLKELSERIIRSLTHPNKRKRWLSELTILLFSAGVVNLTDVTRFRHRLMLMKRRYKNQEKHWNHLD